MSSSFIKKWLGYTHPYWLFFLFLLGLGTIGYTGWTAYKGWSYWQLSRQVAPSSLHWSSVKWEEGDFQVQGDYTFSYEGKDYQGSSFMPEHYLNTWATQEAISRLSVQHPMIWFNPQDPANSTLQKRAPIKEFVSAAVLWTVCLYFVGLGRYVARYYV